MSESTSELKYQLYRSAKILIERSTDCCKEDHSQEPFFQQWVQAVKTFDGLGRGYAERYEKEKSDDSEGHNQGI